MPRLALPLAFACLCACSSDAPPGPSGLPDAGPSVGNLGDPEVAQAPSPDALPDSPDAEPTAEVEPEPEPDAEPETDAEPDAEPDTPLDDGPDLEPELPPPPVPTAVPALLGTTPLSPGADLAPQVEVLAEPGALVRVYAASCLNEPVASGEAGADGTIALAVAVSPNGPTEIHATAQLEGELESECAGPLEYVHDDQPPTFGGAESAQAASDTALTVLWGGAPEDNLSLEETLSVEVCVSALEGDCVESFEAQATAPAAGPAQVEGLAPSTRYWVVAKARDAAGNLDANAKEVSARTWGPGAHIDLAASPTGTACTVSSVGEVYCWGGLDAPTDLPGPALQVAVGAAHGCALLADGEVWCWGEANEGQLGGQPSGPGAAVPVDLPTAALQVAAGDAHNCARLVDGGVRCWGRGLEGQLGSGLPLSSVLAIKVNLPKAARDLGLGSHHSCVVLEDGSGRCWGADTYGQLGDGAAGEDSPVPVLVSLLLPATSVDAGAEHSCAVTVFGGVQCWGRNQHKQLGKASGELAATASSISGLGAPVIEVSAGATHTCARTAAGQLGCWGSNAAGQLGQLDLEDSAAPIGVFLTGASRAVAGHGQSCATTAGELWCWGTPAGGLDATQPTPDPMVAEVAFAGVAVGGAGRCAWRSNGRAICFEGLGAPPDDPIAQIVVGDTQACALLASGAVECWYDAPSAVEVTDAVALSAGGDTICARTAKGKVRCWDAGDTPATVPDLDDAVAVAVGGSHVCALRAGGGVRCWGSDSDGQLGVGGAPGGASDVPLDVSLPSAAAAIAAGGRHTCARLANGQLWCWGANDYGQLGIGTVDAAAEEPTLVAGVDPSRALSLGADHSCLLGPAGQAWCWGAGGAGQLGLGEAMSVPVPVKALAPGPHRALSAGGSGACTVDATGALWCWGGGADLPSQVTDLP